MSIVVQKYGGTSVGSIDRVRAVAERVRRTKDAGHQVVVVVSAMAGETDRLLQLAHAISDMPDSRELDMLLATGEMVSIALLAMALQELGCEAVSFTGTQGGIVTTDVHTRARIKQIEATRLKAALAQGIIPVVAGFQGTSEAQDVTTLGRGGSDLTAVALAAESRETAEHLLGPHRLVKHGMRTGRMFGLLATEAAHAHPAMAEAAGVEMNFVAGTGGEVAEQLEKLAAELGAAELMMTVSATDIDDRVTSIELVADAWS